MVSGVFILGGSCLNVQKGCGPAPKRNSSEWSMSGVGFRCVICRCDSLKFDFRALMLVVLGLGGVGVVLTYKRDSIESQGEIPQGLGLHCGLVGDPKHHP